MIIGEDYYESIVVTNSDDEPVAIISDEEIIEKEGYKVILEPVLSKVIEKNKSEKMDTLKRIKQLEKKLAALEVQVQEQLTASKLDGEKVIENILNEIKRDINR